MDSNRLILYLFIAVVGFSCYGFTFLQRVSLNAVVNVSKKPESVFNVVEIALATEKRLGAGQSRGLIDSIKWDELYPGWRRNWIAYNHPVLGWDLEEISNYILLKNQVMKALDDKTLNGRTYRLPTVSDYRNLNLKKTFP